MNNGEVVEEGPTTAVFDNPQHPYTNALLQAAPRLPLLPTTVAHGTAPEPRTATDSYQKVPTVTDG